MREVQVSPETVMLAMLAAPASTLIGCVIGLCIIDCSNSQKNDVNDTIQVSNNGLQKHIENVNEEQVNNIEQQKTSYAFYCNEAQRGR